MSSKKNFTLPNKKKVKEDTTDSNFTLKDINQSALDKSYVLSEIAKKCAPKPIKKDDITDITTSLEKLGISTAKKQTSETIYWGEYYEINMFCTNENGSKPLEEISKNRKCTNCHQLPPKGSLMIIVPYKYVSSYIEDYVYAPECINIVKNINVDLSKEDKAKTKKHDPKTAPKVNYFRKDVLESKQQNYQEKLVEKDYFEGTELVCSFPCCLARGIELSASDSKYRNVRMYINWMYKKIFGKLPTNLKPAPHFTSQIEYGGNYTLEEYRNNFNFINIDDSNQTYCIANKIMNINSKIFVQTKRLEIK